MAKALPSPSRRLLSRLLLLVCIPTTLLLGYRLLPHDIVAVRAARAEVGTVRDVVSSSVAGEVTPELHAQVRAEIAGIIRAVPHKVGDRVKKGELIIKLDEADLDARLLQTQANTATMEGQLLQAHARLYTLQQQAARAKNLLAHGAGTAQVSQDAAAAVNEAIQALRAAEGSLKAAQAAQQIAKIARGHADITAPFAGELTEILPNLGDNLTLNTPVFQIIDDSRLHVDATIDEADAAKVRPGQEAELSLDALPDHPIKGRVSRADPAVKRDAKGSRTLGVEVEVLDAREAVAAGLKPGMSANVEIVVADKHDVLYLPTNVIVGRGVSRTVFLLVPEGKGFRARKTEIKVGLSNWDRSEVIAGVARGDQVVASLNAKGLDDGVLCSILPERQSKSP